MSSNITLRQVSLGLRHRRTFRIAEIAGSIIDHIVHGDSPLGITFERTDAILDKKGENKGRILVDEDGSNSLVVDIDSVILNLATSDIKETLSNIKTRVVSYITKEVYKKFGIENFNRLGIVYQYEIEGDPSTLLSRLTNGKFNKAEGGVLRFTSREADSLSRVMEGLLDYKNYIITLEFNEEEFIAKFDYQYYFTPEIKSISDINFEGFLQESEEKLNDRFLTWINNEEQK